MKFFSNKINRLGYNDELLIDYVRISRKCKIKFSSYLKKKKLQTKKFFYNLFFYLKSPFHIQDNDNDNNKDAVPSLI